MKRNLAIIAIALAAVGAAAQMVTVSGSQIKDATGTLLASVNVRTDQAVQGVGW